MEQLLIPPGCIKVGGSPHSPEMSTPSLPSPTDRVCLVVNILRVIKEDQEGVRQGVLSCSHPHESLSAPLSFSALPAHLASTT